MKKLVFIVLVIFVNCFGIYGCGSFNILQEKDSLKESVCVDSKVNYIYTIPSCNGKYNVAFQAPFFRVYSGKDVYSEYLESQSEYIIGEEVILYGENVDEMDGAIVSVTQYPLSDYADDEFYNKTLEDYYIEKYRDSEDDGKIRDIIKKKKKNILIAVLFYFLI